MLNKEEFLNRFNKTIEDSGMYDKLAVVGISRKDADYVFTLIMALAASIGMNEPEKLAESITKDLDIKINQFFSKFPVN